MRKIIVVLLTAIGPVSWADIVWDPWLEASMVGEFAKESIVLADQLASLKDQVKKTQQQIDLMVKKNKYGDDWYGQDELWMPHSIEDFQAGNYGEYLSDRYHYYEELFPINVDSIDSQHATSREREQYAYASAWNNYSRAAFSKKFDESYETVERINKMIKESNNMESPKQSADFQIRMMGELAKLSQQQTELQALQLHLMTIQLEDVKLAKEHNADFWKYTYEN